MGPMVARPGPTGPHRFRVGPAGRRRGQTVAGSAVKLARSCSRGSFEKISTTGDLEPETALDDADLVLLVPQHERDRHAALARTGGAAGAVEVGLVVLGRVVVDHDVDGVDVDAAGGDVGGDEHRDACPP